MKRISSYILAVLLVAASAFADAQPKPELYNNRRRDFGVVMAPAGSATRPTLALEYDDSGENEGFYLDTATPAICAAINGVQVACFDPSGFSLTGFTAGSVLFIDSAGGIEEDNASLFFDDTDNQFVLGGGSASRPSLTFSKTDEDTGMRRIGNGQLSIVLDGVDEYVFTDGTLEPGDATGDLGSNGLSWDQVFQSKAEFVESDIISGCVAGSFFIYADDSENKLKKCEEGVLSDLDTNTATSPGGSDTQVQFNNAGAFGGDAGLTYSLAGDDLTVGDVVSLNTLDMVDDDTNPSCAAGEYKLYSDTSETKWKKCENGSASDLDTDTTVPGGANTQVQFNSSGVLAGDAGLTYDSAGDDLTVTDVVSSNTLDITDDDSDPSCAAGEYKIFADTSETKIKKCENGTVSGLTAGAVMQLSSQASEIGDASDPDYVGCGSGSGTGTEANEQCVAPIAGTIRNLHCIVTDAPGGAATWTLTLRKNSVSTAVTCAVTAAGTSCSDTTNSVAVAAGDKLAVQADATSAPANTKVRCAIQVS